MVLLIIFISFFIGIPSICFPLIDIFEKKQQKEYEEQLNQQTSEKIAEVNTYQNENISNNDVMNYFKSQCILHLGQCIYYSYEYEVYKERNNQNYAWAVMKYKNGHYTSNPIIFPTHNWTFYHKISFHFSNGYFSLTATKDFFIHHENPLKQNSSIKNTLTDIENALDACRNESILMWKKYNKNPSYIGTPFSYFSLILDSNHQAKHEKGDNKENTPPPKPPRPSDILSFYRNLLGLKLMFSQTELKIAFRKAAERYHPDKYISASDRDRENAETLMKQINEANEILKEYCE